jgi:hypothetical protein
MDAVPAPYRLKRKRFDHEPEGLVAGGALRVLHGDRECVQRVSAVFEQGGAAGYKRHAAAGAVEQLHTEP